MRDEHARTIAPARALAAEALTRERTLSDLVKQAYALTPGDIALMWQAAPPRMAIARPRLDSAGLARRPTVLPCLPEPHARHRRY